MCNEDWDNHNTVQVQNFGMKKQVVIPNLDHVNVSLTHIGSNK